MTTTNPLTAAASQDATLSKALNAPPTEKSDRSALSSDFETFLRMLTVQLQNQDPLNPVEASDYAVQLATFSGVEQQVKTNELLSDLGRQLQLSGLGQYAGWVGMQARHDGPANFEGAPISVQVRVQPGATRAELVAQDASGTVVQRLPIAAQDGPVDWAGVASDGTPLPPGPYRFFVESFDGQTSLGVDPAEVYSTIAEARLGDSGAVLQLVGGVEIAPDKVTGLRAGAGG